jgi:hypothetical protein
VHATSVFAPTGSLQTNVTTPDRVACSCGHLIVGLRDLGNLLFHLCEPALESYPTRMMATSGKEKKRENTTTPKDGDGTEKKRLTVGACP